MRKFRYITTYFIILTILLSNIQSASATAYSLGGIGVAGQAVMNQEIWSQLAFIGSDSAGISKAIQRAAAGIKDPVEWLSDMASSWLRVQKLQWGTALAIASAGAKYLSDGRLLFNAEFSDFLTDFYNWLWNAESGPNIIQYADKGELNYATLNPDLLQDKSMLMHPDYVYSLNIYQMGTVEFTTSDGYKYVFTGSSTCYAFRLSPDGDHSQLLTFSDVPFSWNTTVFYPNGSIRWQDNGQSSSMTNKGITYYYYNFGSQADRYLNAAGISPGYIQKPDGTYTGANSWDVAYMWYHGAAIGDDVVVGNPGALGGLTGDRDINVLVPPDLMDLPDINIGADETGTIDINDYLGGVTEGILNGDGSIDVNIVGADGIDRTETTDFTFDNTQDIENTQTATDSITGTIENVSDVTEVEDLKPFTLDLRDYFPFCIPFDIYNMITILVADPVAPHVIYPFEIPGIVEYEIDLDLSEFDTVAQVLRTMELLAAAVGLALITKRLIQGGD